LHRAHSRKILGFSLASAFPQALLEGLEVIRDHRRDSHREGSITHG